MSTIKSDNSDLTINASGSTSDIKFQANGVEKASISSTGAFTSTTIDATALTGLVTDDTVDESSLKSDNAPTNNYVLTAKSTAAGGLTWAAAAAGGISDLSPYFMAHAPGGQVPSAQTWTKLIIGAYQDSDAAFASNRFTVPSGEGGRYFLSLSCTMHTGSSYFVKGSNLKIYKNGSAVSGAESSGASQYMPGDGANSISIAFSTILTLAAGDYIEAYGNVATSECTTCAVSFSTRTFSGFKIGA